MSSKNFTFVNDADSSAGEYFVPNDTVSIVPGTIPGSPDGYDAVGAMKFVIVTVVFYSIFGVLCALSTKIIRRRKNRIDMNQRESIARYLKLERKLKIDGYKMKLMSETRQWRQKHFSNKKILERTGSIESTTYDTECCQEKTQKSFPFNLYNISEENEISDDNTLKHPEYNTTDSFYRQVETDGVRLHDTPLGELDYADNWPQKSREQAEKLTVVNLNNVVTAAENWKSQSTHRIGDDLDGQAKPKCTFDTAVEIERYVTVSAT
ncbi:hypothetical protein ACJMK2_040512 [Sinanodonta woodiana]|uniref:Uncharacterized protein n=1 Tax=Sinanodonta woodiana TaxID=1069815 RepID=A0ABD3W185_SINWO